MSDLRRSMFSVECWMFDVLFHLALDTVTINGILQAGMTRVIQNSGPSLTRSFGRPMFQISDLRLLTSSSRSYGDLRGARRTKKMKADLLPPSSGR